MKELDEILDQYGIYINKDRDYKALDSFIEEKIGRTVPHMREYNDEKANLLLSMYFGYWADWKIGSSERFARVFGFDAKEKEIPKWYFDYFSLSGKGNEKVIFGIRTADRYRLENLTLKAIERSDEDLPFTKRRFDLLEAFNIENAEQFVREEVVKKIVTIVKEYEESPVTKEMTEKMLKLVEREYKRIIAQYP